MRLKTTRFVLPHMKGWSNHFDWDTVQKLRDIDKVFRMLDGKIGEGTPEDPFYGLAWAANNCFSRLRAAERVETEYFDFRWYQGVQTMHFYPKSKKLIDRLNRLVGRHRQWIPPEGERVSDAFWLQYDKAEKFDKELRADIKAKDSRSYGWGTLGAATRALMGTNRHDDGEGIRAIASLEASLTSVLEKNGISVNFQLEDKGSEEANTQEVLQLPLLAA
jgi:hypothetical protein